jgi:hypothetical protein
MGGNGGEERCPDQLDGTVSSAPNDDISTSIKMSLTPGRQFHISMVVET